MKLPAPQYKQFIQALIKAFPEQQRLADCSRLEKQGLLADLRSGQSIW